MFADKNILLFMEQMKSEINVLKVVIDGQAAKINYLCSKMVTPQVGNFFKCEFTMQFTSRVA